MNYGTIKNLDIANGEGIRVSLFVSGCTHHCKNCFNPETWNFDYGQQFTEETIHHILTLLEPNHIAGLTLLGGEPLHPNNQQKVSEIIKAVRAKFGNKKTIWCYTGYTYEHLPKELMSNIDVLVDGLYVEELKDISLKFRGSSNQRIIDVQKTLQSNKIILYSK